MSKKTLKVIVHDSKEIVDEMEISLTKKMEQDLKRMDKLSCKCEEPDNCPRFVRNYKGVNHGYICKKCGKFVQFG